MFLSKKLMGAGGATGSGGGGSETVYSADLTNASPDNVELYVGSNIPAPRGMAFNSDGSELVILCSSTDKYHTYSLSNNYLITGTVTYLGASRTLSTGRNNPFGMCFGKNGERLYNTDGNDKVLEYHIPSADAYDVSEATYQGIGQEYNTNSFETFPTGLRFNPDGTKMYIVGNTGNDITEVALSTAWDVSTGTTSSIVSFSVYFQDNAPSDLEFNSNGTKMYVIGRATDDVFQYSLTTAYDLSTASYDNISYSPPSSVDDANHEGILFNPTYTKMFLVGRSSDKVQQYSCD